MKKKYIGGDKDFYIHFDNPEQCSMFKKNYKQRIGHTCCNGKGCKLLDVKSWDEIRSIKKDFLVKMDLV